MIIQIDSREKQKAIKDIVRTFDQMGVKHYSSKLYVGDYMNLDNPKLIIDRKQNLTELCSNICQGHERFRSELIRARENGIQLVILVEHGDPIFTLEDVQFWQNPRKVKTVKEDGKWIRKETKAMTGRTMYKILCTMQRKYGVQYDFCDKSETGRRIIEILKGGGGCWWMKTNTRKSPTNYWKQFYPTGFHLRR